MTQFILDLGVPKTGSKARQAFFAAELESCSGGAATYVNVGQRDQRHEDVFFALRKGDPRLLDDIRAEAEATGCRFAVLSYEAFDKLDTEAIALLSRHLPDVRVVVFLRRQDELLNSVVNEYCKSYDFTFNDLQRIRQGICDFQPRWDYAAMLERWQEALAPGAVTPVLFDRNVSSVRSFLAATGIVCDGAQMLDDDLNPSVDPFGMAVLEHVKSKARDDELVHFVKATRDALETRFLGRALPFVWTISDDERARIMALYADANEQVRRRFFPDRPELFTPTPAVEAPAVDTAKARRLARRIVVRTRHPRLAAKWARLKTAFG